MAMYNGIEVSPEILGIALAQSKIEAIRALRNTFPDTQQGYSTLGLKEAKDAVEAAMAAYDTEGLRRALAQSEMLAREYARTNHILRTDLRNAQAAVARLARDVEVLRGLISDHAFGIAPLPVLTPPDESDGLPF